MFFEHLDIVLFIYLFILQFLSYKCYNFFTLTTYYNKNIFVSFTYLILEVVDWFITLLSAVVLCPLCQTEVWLHMNAYVVPENSEGVSVHYKQVLDDVPITVVLSK